MRNLGRLFAAVAVLCSAATIAAQSPRESLLVNTTWLASHLTDANLVLLHMGDPAEYAAGHIPGSRLISRADISAPAVPGGLTLELPPPEELRAKLAGLGVSDDSRVIVIFGKDWVSPATRVVLTLQAAGLGARTSLLDGGLAAWQREGRSVTAEVPPAKAGRLSALKMTPAIVDAEFVKANLSAARYAIVDARDRVFYDGTRTGGSQTAPHKTGHIAGAKSLPYSSLVNDDNTLKPAAELESLFAQAGVKRGDTVVAYCHIGQQATAIVFAARTLSLDAKLYDGSFEDWSKKDGPVETTVK